MASTPPPTAWFVLPAYNEEAALGPLIEGIAAALAGAGRDCRIVVVDDGSADRTGEVAAGAAQALPVTVVTHPVNLGLGATVRDGLWFALDRAGPEDTVVTLDADGTHPPDLSLEMLRRRDAGADLVIASRYRPGSEVTGVPPHREALSLAAAWIFRALYPIPGVRDYTCGYRAYRAGLLARAVGGRPMEFFDQPGFQCMIDILLKLRRFRPACEEVPLSLRYDRKEGPSKMKVARTIARTLALLLRHRPGRGR